jgi:hypothetical protein
MGRSPYIYDKSVSYPGYLIVPFIFSRLGGEFIYSYALLSDRGYQGKFHQRENPAKLYANSLQGIISISQQHLDKFVKKKSKNDYFYNRYTYLDNLIIIHYEVGKYFYDHYSPKELTNIAAPKLFLSVQDCIDWVKYGLDNPSGNSQVLG